MQTKDNDRPVERDTFDLREHNFFPPTMKEYIPSRREQELHLVLAYCGTAIFSKGERFAINLERAKLMANNLDFKQDRKLEEKIQYTLQKIKDTKWIPETNI